MSIKKTVSIPMETTAYYQALSKLNVQFWNQDKNTAELRFLITRNDFPLPLSTENVKIILALESGESFITTDDLDIENEVEGVATYIIPPEFMAVATNVTGQICVATIDGDEIVVQRKFSFEVAEDLLSTIPSEEKIRYIKMFDDLRVDMNNRLDGVTNALSQLESNIDAVNNARETGITAINDLYNAKLVTFNQNFDDKMALINGAIEDLEEYATVTLSDMTTKKEEFDASVTGSGLITTGQTDNWQKYKLTDDDGNYPNVSLNNDLSTLQALPPGFYYGLGTPITISGVSTSGFIEVSVKPPGTVKHIVYRPYNINKEFVMRYYNEWSGWENKIDGLEKTIDAQSKANTAENNAKVYTDTKLAATRATLFSGSVNGVNQNINLTQSMDNFSILIISGSFTGGVFNETVLVSTMGTSFPIQRLNLSNITGGNPYLYELGLARVNSTRLTIEKDLQYGVTNENATIDANNFTIRRIEAIK